MERLQAALEAARKKREGQDDGPAHVRSAPPGPRPQAPGVDELWDELAGFQPVATDLHRHRVVTQVASAAATPFDILRTKILLQMRQHGWTRLAVTSPVPRSGKTTTACNLALGLGRQHELRAMLFDLDLREPSVHRFFEIRPEHSIGDMLGGSVPFARQAVRIGSNVAVSMANRPEPDPTRILLAEKTESVLDEIQARYKPDLMIFDLPSVLVSDDARAFLKNVDCALIIARANATRYSQFDACEREVAEHTNVLGAVLNAVRNIDAASSFD